MGSHEAHGERLADLLYRLRPGDIIEYEGSGDGREGSVTVRVSEIAARDETYCIFGEGKQGGEYALFPNGRPGGRKFDPPEACFIAGSQEDPLSDMKLATHGTILWMRVIVNSEVMDDFNGS